MYYVTVQRLCFNSCYRLIYTSSLRIERCVLQGDCLSPLIFNILINPFIQYVRQERFSQLSYSLSKLLRAIHWFQCADDAAIATGQEYQTQALLNAFTAWCIWSSMIIRVDTFGMTKKKHLVCKHILNCLLIMNKFQL